MLTWLIEVIDLSNLVMGFERTACGLVKVKSRACGWTNVDELIQESNIFFNDAWLSSY